MRRLENTHETQGAHEAGEAEIVGATVEKCGNAGGWRMARGFEGVDFRRRFLREKDATLVSSGEAFHEPLIAPGDVAAVLIPLVRLIGIERLPMDAEARAEE